jgi:hypothetical protein
VQAGTSFFISGAAIFTIAQSPSFAVEGPAFNSYQWFVNGVAQSGATASTFTLNAGTSPDLYMGKNRIMVVVSKNGTFYSEELNVEMTGS